jgi:hypothetical protein
MSWVIIAPDLIHVGGGVRVDAGQADDEADDGADQAEEHQRVRDVAQVADLVAQPHLGDARLARTGIGGSAEEFAGGRVRRWRAGVEIDIGQFKPPDLGPRTGRGPTRTRSRSRAT